ncbi:MAG: Sulfatase [Chitinophagaceae bacterium]|nr:Sulfatase [Chitinophagaceae bacterium]
MGKKIRLLLARPLLPYLYGLSFIIFKTSAFFPLLDFKVGFALYTLYCLITFLLLKLFAKIFSLPGAIVYVLIIWGCLLHTARIAQILGYSYGYIPRNFYFSLYGAIIVLFIVLLVFFKNYQFRAYRQFNEIGNTFFIIISVLFIFRGITENRKRVIIDSARIHIDGQLKAKEKPNIIWILMDEYGSPEVLKTRFAFSNPLVEDLRKRNFYVFSTIQSRYNITLYSINCIFNFDDSIVPRGFYNAERLLNENAFVPTLQKAGYNFINLSFFDIGNNQKIENRSGFPNDYFDMDTAGTLFSLLYGEWKFSQKNCDAFNQLLLERLNDTLETKTQSPKFIWAHFLIPHAPFCRTANGSSQRDVAYSGYDSGFIKNRYTGYIGYANRILDSLLDQHPSLLKSIIIISGDHGPRFLFIKENAVQYSPMAAIYLPIKYDTTRLARLRYISQIPQFIIQQFSR